MADSQHSTPALSAKADALVHPPALADLRINGMMPFSAGPADAVMERLNEVHGLLLALANGYDCAGDAGGAPGEIFVQINPLITASALGGIATLVSLAMHHTEVGDEERRAAAMLAKEANNGQA